MGLKSKIAFEFSLRKFDKEVYFWTLTMVKPATLPELAKAWNRCWSRSKRSIYNCYPTISALRVFEEHPGKGDITHGWHVHLICNQRMDIDIVKRLWALGGGGHCWVKKIPREQAGYVAKYLGKPRNKVVGNYRLWAALGHLQGEKVADIQVENRFTETYKFLAMMYHGFKSLDWRTRVQITHHFTIGDSIIDALKFHLKPDRYTIAEEERTWDDILGPEDEGDGDIPFAELP